MPTAKNTPVIEIESTSSSTNCHNASPMLPVQITFTSVAKRATTA